MDFSRSTQACREAGCKLGSQKQDPVSGMLNYVMIFGYVIRPGHHNLAVSLRSVSLNSINN